MFQGRLIFSTHVTPAFFLVYFGRDTCTGFFFLLRKCDTWLIMQKSVVNSLEYIINLDDIKNYKTMVNL